jgi:hypothetical protein
MKAIMTVMSVLLIASIFATGFAAAESGSGRLGTLLPYPDSTVAVSDDSTSVSFNSEIELEDAILVESSSETALEAEVDASVDSTTHRGYPAHAFVGSGWAIDDDKKGYLATMHWVSKVFVSKESPSEDGKEVVRGVARVGNMKFIFSSEGTPDTDNDKVFVVYSNRGEGRTKAGTLTLEQQSRYGDVIVWEGKLALESGAVYQVHIATKERTAKTNSSSKSDVRTKSVQIECYSGAKESFSLESGNTEEIYAKARAFCANECKDGKCGINTLRAVNAAGDVETNTKVKVDSGKIEIEEETESTTATSVDASGKGFVSFWKRVFSRSEVKSTN